MTGLDWAMVRARYAAQPQVRPLAGGSVLQVVSVDDEQICLKQRLWQDCVTRTQLETAYGLLQNRAAPGSAVEFAEELRRYYAGGPDVRPDCTRVPNLSAIILKDLGYLG
ncbi:hypothetical protein [Pseudonocardia acidicola]|uniref:Uncharacterized protein n=1 Tax=Pseudonocardia acidicola TaxID=2724939 RepID=A0ABX1SDF9_9PSEU|nr:hypothetical protein [Pseudonocardia acidicola]NMH98299.1 hypothetical protein [Pseudonocardia acidicola]